MENKKLGIAKKDIKEGDIIKVTLSFEDGLLHSDEINCFESITLKDFLD